MSSRNGYLTQTQKIEAVKLQQTLKSIATKIQQGDIEFAALIHQATQTLNNSGWLVDYISICSASTLMPAGANDKALVILTAAKIGNTRLIDNIELTR